MTLHLFNPENDLALADFSIHYIAPSSARVMAADLSALPLWWAAPGDAVWVEEAQRPSLSAVWNPLCRCLQATPCSCWPDGVDEICPWGWSPLLVGRLLRAGCPPVLLPDEPALRRIRTLSGRSLAVRLLHELRSGEGFATRWADRLCGASYYCEDEEQVARLVTSLGPTMLKAPWSGSGKGLHFGHGTYVPPLSGWCRGVLRRQGAVVVEPIYNKVYDLAMEFFSDGCGRVSYRGLSVFFTTPRGTYAGNWVAPEHDKLQWLSGLLPLAQWHDLAAVLCRRLSLYVGTAYRGVLGVDMMLCRPDSGASLLLHPCVEVNLRRTMGQAALDMAAWLAPGVQARFMVDHYAGADVLLGEVTRRQLQDPPVVEDGRLLSGYLPLVPASTCSQYMASLQVMPASALFA